MLLFLDGSDFFNCISNLEVQRFSSEAHVLGRDVAAQVDINTLTNSTGFSDDAVRRRFTVEQAHLIANKIKDAQICEDG